jgi:hypothetical protein
MSLSLIKVTSESVNMQELSMLCMDWVSGVPREERVTKFLFCAPDTETAFVPSEIWDKTVIRLSKANLESLSRVRPAYTTLTSLVDNATTINLKTLCEALNRASGDKVFVVEVDTYPPEVV